MNTTDTYAATATYIARNASVPLEARILCRLAAPGFGYCPDALLRGLGDSALSKQRLAGVVARLIAAGQVQKYPHVFWDSHFNSDCKHRRRVFINYSLTDAGIQTKQHLITTYSWG
jgi:hypothetical protein